MYEILLGLTKHNSCELRAYKIKISRKLHQDILLSGLF